MSSQITFPSPKHPRLCLLRLFRQMHGCNTASVPKQSSMQARLSWPCRTTSQPTICTTYDSCGEVVSEKSSDLKLVGAHCIHKPCEHVLFFLPFWLQFFVFQSASDWIPDRCPHASFIAMQPCDPSSAFFGFMGVTSALVFANLGAAPCQRTISLEHQPYYDMTLSSWTIKEV